MGRRGGARGAGGQPLTRPGAQAAPRRAVVVRVDVLAADAVREQRLEAGLLEHDERDTLRLLGEGQPQRAARGAARARRRTSSQSTVALPVPLSCHVPFSSRRYSFVRSPIATARSEELRHRPARRTASRLATASKRFFRFSFPLCGGNLSNLGFSRKSPKSYTSFICVQGIPRGRALERTDGTNSWNTGIHGCTQVSRCIRSSCTTYGLLSLSLQKL